MHWEPHYTGIEMLEKEIGFGRYASINFYAQRDRKTKEHQFWRISGFRWSYGVFLRRCNYGKSEGFEFFSYSPWWDLHWGVRRNYRRWRIYKKLGLEWSGSSMEPYNACTMFVGPVYIGFRSPPWLKALKKYLDQRRYRYEPLYDENDFPF